VQVAIHCEPMLEDPFDVLLVDGRRVVYLTSGFAGGLPKGAAVVADPGECPRQGPDASPAASAVRAGAAMGTASGHSD
jgi:hypothetical protein